MEEEPAAPEEPRNPEHQQAPATGPPQRAGAARAVMTGIALGLADVFDPERRRDDVVIEQEAPAQPLDPQPVEVHVENRDPRDSYAVYRPWLEGHGTSGEAGREP